MTARHTPTESPAEVTAALARWREVDSRSEASEEWWNHRIGPQPELSDDDLRLIEAREPLRKLIDAYSRVGYLTTTEIDDLRTLAAGGQWLTLSLVERQALCTYGPCSVAGLDWLIERLASDDVSELRFAELYEFEDEDEDDEPIESDATEEPHRAPVEVLVEIAPRWTSPPQAHPHAGTPQYKQAHKFEAKARLDRLAHDDLPAAVGEVLGRTDAAGMRRPLSEVDAGKSAKAADAKRSAGLSALAQEWLRGVHSLTPPITVDEAIAGACEHAGLSLDEMRGAFTGKPGRRSAARLALRARVREALLPLYEAGHAPTKMADLLGCPYVAFWRLMTAN